MKPHDVVQQILKKKKYRPKVSQAMAFAPTNIALCKYWGKRDENLNLPVNSSLSISLGNKGTQTKISITDDAKDHIKLNGEQISEDDDLVKRVVNYLDLFRLNSKMRFLVETENNIPIKAGVASSASGFAALVLALNQLFAWEIDKKSLSILARLGSGSACRSLWSGFVKWHRGEQENGMDSFAEPLSNQWPNFRIGLYLISKLSKKIDSRTAMRHTVQTAKYYLLWPKQAKEDLQILETALQEKNFELLGQTAESNALAMHACMLNANPPICYFEPKTIEVIQKIWQLRKEGLPVYFTQDAGANLKLLFLKQDEQKIKNHFPEMEIINPFER